MDTGVVLFLFGMLGSVLGALLAYGFSRYSKRNPRYTPTNALELLLQSRPEEWNEVRILNPDWTPDLRKAKLSGTSLPLVNLQSVRLDEADLSESNLEGAVLDRASLVGTDLTRANLTGASLRYTDLRSARLEETCLDRVMLEGARIDRYEVKGFTEARTSVDIESLRHRQFSVDDLADLTPRELEALVARLLAEVGYKVHLSSSTRDMGYDLIVDRPDPLFGQESILVEVKKYAPDRVVGTAPVRSFFGAMLNNNIQKGLFVTTGRFSKEAMRLPQSLASIRMVDGEALSEWLNTGTLTSSTERGS